MMVGTIADLMYCAVVFPVSLPYDNWHSPGIAILILVVCFEEAKNEKNDIKR